jgi:hypothetical protein
MAAPERRQRGGAGGQGEEQEQREQDEAAHLIWDRRATKSLEV